MKKILTPDNTKIYRKKKDDHRDWQDPEIIKDSLNISNDRITLIYKIDEEIIKIKNCIRYNKILIYKLVDGNTLNYDPISDNKITIYEKDSNNDIIYIYKLYQTKIIKCIAENDIFVSYAGGKVRINKGKIYYYNNEIKQILIGWHGSNPPKDQDGNQIIKLDSYEHPIFEDREDHGYIYMNNKWIELL